MRKFWGWVLIVPAILLAAILLTVTVYVAWWIIIPLFVVVLIAMALSFGLELLDGK